MATKTCKDCGEVKPFDQFVFNRYMKSGVGTYCKICMNARTKRYYWTNREKVLGSVALQRARNRTAEQQWKRDNPHRLEEYRHHMANRKRELDIEWRKSNKERLQALYRKSGLKKRGTTIEEYERVLAEQHGVCAICEKASNNGKRLAIDHDHGCEHDERHSCSSCFRGLLCTHCNVALHKMETMDGWHLKALAYLERAKERQYGIRARSTGTGIAEGRSEE